MISYLCLDQHFVFPVNLAKRGEQPRSLPVICFLLSPGISFRQSKDKTKISQLAV
jgi:hypothetical protein